MTNSEESENRLKQKFNKELLPTWDFEKVFLEYGKKLLEKKEFQKAANIFDDVLYVYPENIKAQKLKKISNIRLIENLAHSYLAENDLEKALTCFDEALELNPGDQEIIDLRQSLIEKYLNVHIDGIQHKIEWVKGQVSLFIAAACEIIVRLGDKIVFKEKVDAHQLFQGTISTSFPSGKSDNKPSISKKEGGISFEVHRGMNKGRLTIKLNRLK